MIGENRYTAPRTHHLPLETLCISGLKSDYYQVGTLYLIVPSIIKASRSVSLRRVYGPYEKHLRSRYAQMRDPFRADSQLYILEMSKPHPHLLSCRTYKSQSRYLGGVG